MISMDLLPKFVHMVSYEICGCHLLLSADLGSAQGGFFFFFLVAKDPKTRNNYCVNCQVIGLLVRKFHITLAKKLR